jgi:hypothetical protein
MLVKLCRAVERNARPARQSFEIASSCKFIAGARLTFESKC